jgi:hypothetical protein
VCYPIQGPNCGKTRWGGFGQHVDNVGVDELPDLTLKVVMIRQYLRYPMWDRFFLAAIDVRQTGETDGPSPAPGNSFVVDIVL